MALEITDGNYNEIVANAELPVVLDFWAVWCGPCRMIAPHIEEMAKEYKGKAIIGKVDVDSSPETATKFGIRNIPTVLFIKNGQVVDKQVSACPKQVLVNKLNAIL